MSDESPHNAVPDSSAVESGAPDVSSSKASAEVSEAIASDACGAVSAENSPAQEEVADTACATDAAGGPVVAEIVAAQADDQVPPLACNSVSSAIGWCLGLLAIQFVLGMHLGALFVPMRKLPGAVVLFALNGICVLVSATIMVHRVYPGAVRRVLALRMPPLFHMALVVLAVAPNLLFYSACEEACARLTRQTSMAPVSGLCTWHPVPLAAGPHSSPFSLLDEQFMELARESWMAILLLGCLLPAVGEELFFRGFLGRGLVARYGLVRGVALTSLAFGLLHLAPQRIGFATFLGCRDRH